MALKRINKVQYLQIKDNRKKNEKTQGKALEKRQDIDKMQKNNKKFKRNVLNLLILLLY